VSRRAVSPPHRPDSCRRQVRVGAGQGSSLLDRGAACPSRVPGRPHFPWLLSGRCGAPAIGTVGRRREPPGAEAGHAIPARVSFVDDEISLSPGGTHCHVRAKPRAAPEAERSGVEGRRRGGRRPGEPFTEAVGRHPGTVGGRGTPAWSFGGSARPVNAVPPAAGEPVSAGRSEVPDSWDSSGVHRTGWCPMAVKGIADRSPMRQRGSVLR